MLPMLAKRIDELPAVEKKSPRRAASNKQRSDHER
jgi:hypothetical protein